MESCYKIARFVYMSANESWGGADVGWVCDCILNVQDSLVYIS
jgi:hypothetical protein